MDDGFLFLDEFSGAIRMVAQETTPKFFGTVVLENVEEAVRSQLVQKGVLILKKVLYVYF